MAHYIERQCENCCMIFGTYEHLWHRLCGSCVKKNIESTRISIKLKRTSPELRRELINQR